MTSFVFLRGVFFFFFFFFFRVFARRLIEAKIRHMKRRNAKRRKDQTTPYEKTKEPHAKRRNTNINHPVYIDVAG